MGNGSKTDDKGEVILTLTSSTKAVSDITVSASLEGGTPVKADKTVSFTEDKSDFLPWDPKAEYETGDIVTWKDKTWIAISGNEYGIEPGTDDEVWVEYKPEGIVKAVIDDVKKVYSEQKVKLSAKDSKSSLSDIATYAWEVPKEIEASTLDEAKLTFKAPELKESKDFVIKVTVTDELGYKNTAQHTLTVVPRS